MVPPPPDDRQTPTETYWSGWLDGFAVGFMVKHLVLIAMFAMGGAIGVVFGWFL